MGLFFRKSIVGKFGRINFSKSGVGFSVGPKGLRIGAGPKGPYVRGGMKGVYFYESLKGGRNKSKLMNEETRTEGSSYHMSFLGLALFIFVGITCFNLNWTYSPLLAILVFIFWELFFMVMVLIGFFGVISGFYTSMLISIGIAAIVIYGPIFIPILFEQINKNQDLNKNESKTIEAEVGNRQIETSNLLPIVPIHQGLLKIKFNENVIYPSKYEKLLDRFPVFLDVCYWIIDREKVSVGSFVRKFKIKAADANELLYHLINESLIDWKCDEGFYQVLLNNEGELNRYIEEISTFYPDSSDHNIQTQIVESELKVSRFFLDAAIYVVTNQKCTLYLLQDKFQMKYLEVSQLISELAIAGIIGYGAYEGSNRDVFFLNIEDLNNHLDKIRVV